MHDSNQGGSPLMHSIGTFGRSGKKLAGQAIGFTHSLLNVSAHVVQNKLTNTEKEGAEP